MYWEGEQAVEEYTDEGDASVVQRRKGVMKTPGHADRKQQDDRVVEVLKLDGEESDEADDSEDDYIENKRGHKKVSIILLLLVIVLTLRFFFFFQKKSIINLVSDERPPRL